MSKQIYYKQCKLQGRENLNVTQVCFIPEKMANTKFSVKVGDDTRWWDVIEVYENSRIEESLIRDVAHNAGCIWTATSGPCPRGNK